MATLAEMQAEYLRNIGAGPGGQSAMPGRMPPMQQNTSYAAPLRGAPPPQALQRPGMSPELRAASDAGIDAAALATAKQQYRKKYDSGRGILGLVNSARGAINRDENMRGFQDVARGGLTAARDMEEMQANRAFNEEQAAVMQDRGFKVDDLNTTERGLNSRQQNSIAATASEGGLNRIGRADVAASNQIAQDDRQNDQQRFLTGSENTKPYHDGNGGVVNVRRDPATGATFTVDSFGARTPIDTSTLIPYTAPQTGSVPRAANLERTEDVDLSAIDEQINATTMGRILSSPVFEQATGTFDPERFLGKNIPTTETGRAIQSLNIDMDAMKVNGVAPILGIMGVNPTDKDMELALETMVSSGDQPRAWIDYVRKVFAPRAREVALIRLASGESTREITAEEINAAYSALMKLADDSEARLYPDEVVGAGAGEDFDASQPLSDLDGATQAQRDARAAYLKGPR